MARLKSKQMNEATLNHYLDVMSHDATGNNSTFIKDNEYLLERYMLDPDGNEMPERSGVQSNDVADVVEADMPSLIRTFLGSNEILKFKPNSRKNKDDVTEADEKTKYITWQIFKQPWSFRVLHGFIKNAEIHKLSVVKYFIDENTEVEEHKKTGLSSDELALFIESLQGEDVKKVDVVREEKEDDKVTVVIKVERTTKTFKIVNVPLENFRMTKNAESKDTAMLVGDVSCVTRGELLTQGYSRKDISKIPLSKQSTENTRLKDVRDKGEGGKTKDTIIDSWASEEVDVQDFYPLIDYDGDGIPERRRIMRGGTDVILENEVFNHVPYALLSTILMPHKAIGRSRAEITVPTAVAKTAMLRGLQDNIYAVNNPRISINENVNMDDLLVVRPNGIVRNEGEGSPANNMMPLVIPYIGDKALQVVQYWDMSRAQTTGSLQASQGLNADDLGKETATRFEGVQDASKAKVELVARVIAETGFRELFEGAAWLDANYQNTEVEIEVLGKELTVNPNNWKYKHSVTNNIGLGAGDDDQQLRTLTGLWTMHQQLMQMNSPMTDEVKRFNIAKGITKASGIPEESEYFNNPEKPEDLLLAENEIMRKLVPQLQEQLQNVQNPLAEAEKIKAESSLIQAKGKRELDIATMLEEQRRFNVETTMKQQEFDKTLAAKIAEMELKYKQQVPDNEETEAEFEFDPTTGEMKQVK